MKHIRFRAMGTDIELITSQSVDDHAAQTAKERMLSLEALLSRFREDSDVSRINAGAGEWIHVSADTVQVLLLAQTAFVETRGFFNPFMGNVIEKFGYDVSFEKIGHEARVILSASKPFLAPVSSPLQINESSCQARIAPEYKLDLGGIAKGWIVEQTADVLLQEGISNFICNAGGDLICRGNNDGQPWVVGITDPFHQEKSVVNIDVVNMSMATSGTYRRKWLHENSEVHHIMDPFLGKPVKTDIVSCTVIHESLVQAEVLAKVTLMLGTTKGVAWLEQQHAQGWVVVTNKGEVQYSCSL